MQRLKVLALLLFFSTVAQASAPNDLERFFSGVHTYTARFQQVVLDDKLNITQESSGTLWIERPGKFRWDYDAPFKQQIVGDGARIWVYDVELQQATVRPMSAALGNTPALLLAGKGNIRTTFQLKDLGQRDKLHWVQMLPKQRDGAFDDIRIGFEKGVIRALELVDSFGQTTRITLQGAVENKNIERQRFVFVPPEGVDVISE